MSKLASIASFATAGKGDTSGGSSFTQRAARLIATEVTPSKAPPRVAPLVVDRVLAHNRLLLRAQADEGYVAANNKIDSLGNLVTEQAAQIDGHIAESKALGDAQLAQISKHIEASKRLGEAQTAQVASMAARLAQQSGLIDAQAVRMDEQVAALAADREQQLALAEGLSEQRVDLEVLRACVMGAPAPGEDDERLGYETTRSYAMLYALTTHELLWPRSLLSALACAVLLVLQLACQLVLAHQLWDGATLRAALHAMRNAAIAAAAATSNASGDATTVSAAAADASLYVPDGLIIGGGGVQPRGYAASVVVASVLLALWMRAHTATMLSLPHPIGILLHQPWALRTVHQPMLLYWRLLATLFLEVCWGVRAVLIPSLVVVATGLNCAGSSTAAAAADGSTATAVGGDVTDVLICMIVAGAIMALDEAFYTLADARRRRPYERSPNLPQPLPASPNWDASAFELPHGKWAAPHEIVYTPDSTTIRIHAMLFLVLDAASVSLTYLLASGLVEYPLPGGFDAEDFEKGSGEHEHASIESVIEAAAMNLVHVHTPTIRFFVLGGRIALFCIAHVHTALDRMARGAMAPPIVPPTRGGAPTQTPNTRRGRREAMGPSETPAPVPPLLPHASPPPTLPHPLASHAPTLPDPPASPAPTLPHPPASPAPSPPSRGGNEQGAENGWRPMKQSPCLALVRMITCVATHLAFGLVVDTVLMGTCKALLPSWALDRAVIAVGV